MNHEPECVEIKNLFAGTTLDKFPEIPTGMCGYCEIARKGYQRGRIDERAERAAAIFKAAEILRVEAAFDHRKIINAIIVSDLAKMTEKGWELDDNGCYRESEKDGSK